LQNPISAALRIARSSEQGDNFAPCFGLQFSGRVDIGGKSEVMTVTLKHADNRDLWSVDISPKPDARPGRILAQHI
jgi:alkaline phosphatase D